MPLKVNQPAPDIYLPSTSGSHFKLSRDLANQPGIIYFYPKDFTPGCTQEACSFRDSFSVFRDLNITVVGISRDSIESHQKFKQQHKLPFELLSDKSGEVAKKYQALVPFLKVVRRVTYLLDANHKIAAVYEDMFGAEKHIKQMIEAVKKNA
ncbi:peroxiredoxin [Tunicatimonas pelagia]|uniref:peroxiredoxin n=1 Tax=Tunicatimonas pelagia TaxID=931531 RepID=UPI002665755A|nr:peroxiredoxin [Tunicatimonas pelagia]WKN40896.1 peroxiredoxin [Tunicatimonas pelagia]